MLTAAAWRVSGVNNNCRVQLSPGTQDGGENSMNKLNWCCRLLCFTLLLGAFVPGIGRAEMYGFSRLTNVSPDVASQLTATVADAGSGQVSFTFNNSGPIASTIGEVYFDDGTLLGIASITDGPGVSFDKPATPAELPGANLASPPFVTTQNFSADADNPKPSNGVNPGEWVTITFNLINGQTFANTIAALDSGALRIGLHVQSITGGTSDSYVNDGKVPLPGAVLLGLLGLGAAGMKLRRFA
jgi:hypothetical protein